MLLTRRQYSVATGPQWFVGLHGSRGVRSGLAEQVFQLVRPARFRRRMFVATFFQRLV
jgi:hypothetical protein